MAAAYDDYDYEEYWAGREYEHESEKMALSRFLGKISEIKRVVDFGCGHGRLTDSYSYRAERIYLIDPSAALLKQVREKYGDDNRYKIIQSSIENVGAKIKTGSFDLALMIRVLHHIKDLDEALSVVSKVVKNGGYFILEYPNKRHAKAIISRYVRGDFLFPVDIFSINRGEEKETLPFQNFHPDFIEQKLKLHGFEIIENLSVSNLRGKNIKKVLPLSLMLSIERVLQVIFGGIKFGPSVFVLAKKAA